MSPKGDQPFPTESAVEREVFIEENAPRDGIQSESIGFSVEERVALIDALSACRPARIQIGSFVNPRRVPQMADTERVYERIRRFPEVAYSALVLNAKGLERALSCGIGHISIFVSSGEVHSRKNTNCSVKEAVEQAALLIRRAKDQGVAVQAGVMNAFGCRLEGAVAPERVVEIVIKFQQSGADEVSLADTSGIAHPRQVEALVDRVFEMSDRPLSLHLHDTYGFGMANVYAAWRGGVRRFDASCGGLGGCPFIPGASGNIPTEDMVHLFESMGVPTGMIPDRLAGIVQGLESKLLRYLPSRYARLSPDERGRCRS